MPNGPTDRGWVQGTRNDRWRWEGSPVCPRLKRAQDLEHVVPFMRGELSGHRSPRQRVHEVQEPTYMGVCTWKGEGPEARPVNHVVACSADGLKGPYSRVDASRRSWWARAWSGCDGHRVRPGSWPRSWWLTRCVWLTRCAKGWEGGGDKDRTLGDGPDGGHGRVMMLNIKWLRSPAPDV